MLLYSVLSVFTFTQNRSMSAHGHYSLADVYLLLFAELLSGCLGESIDYLWTQAQVERTSWCFFSSNWFHFIQSLNRASCLLWEQEIFTVRLTVLRHIRSPATLWLRQGGCKCPKQVFLEVESWSFFLSLVFSSRLELQFRVRELRHDQGPPPCSVRWRPYRPVRSSTNDPERLSAKSGQAGTPDSRHFCILVFWSASQVV